MNPARLVLAAAAIEQSRADAERTDSGYDVRAECFLIGAAGAAIAGGKL